MFSNEKKLRENFETNSSSTDVVWESILVGTEINITTVVQSSPATVKALDMLKHLPAIVEILSASGQSTQVCILIEKYSCVLIVKFK